MRPVVSLLYRSCRHVVVNNSQPGVEVAEPLRIVALISGGGSNLQAIIDQCHRGAHRARDDARKVEVVAAISNVPGAYGLVRAARGAIDTHVVDHQQFKTRDSFEAALRQLIDQYAPGLIVLAGFMRILSADFVARYQGTMMNIHPSLLPDLAGLDTHQRAIDGGYRLHGASVHFVTPELDAGPVILQAATAIRADDRAATLAARVLTA